MKLKRVGVDLTKTVFQVHGVDLNEKAVWRRRLSREQWLKTPRASVEPGGQIGMQARGRAPDDAPGSETPAVQERQRGRCAKPSRTRLFASTRAKSMNARAATDRCLPTG